MSIVPFDPTLVSQSVNFHGHNLLKQLVSENAVQIHTIKLQDIDYKVYQNRSTEIRNLGFSRIQEVIGFIASKSDILLVKQPKPCISVEGQKEQDYKDRNSHILPFEYLLHVDKNIRISEVLSTIKTGDILFTEVHSNAEYGCCHLKLLAFDGGVHRYVSDFRPSDVKVVMNYEETVVSKADEDKVGKWLLGTRLRVEVLVVKLDKTLSVICVGTKGTTIPDNMKDKIKLGKVQLQDLPPILSVIPDPNMKYLSQCFMKMATFKNPQCVRQKASELNIDMHSYPSLLTTFRGHISDVGKPNALRKAQMCKWAHKSVADGVTYFKKGQHEEAFQCLNKALQIDPENVEAFVAKGALLANLGRYEKAIEDFEKAMKFNPQHVNARKYMCETLVELGKQSEETGQLKEAEKCYSKCLELSGDHVVAREALESVESKLGIKPEPDKLIKDEQTEVDNFLLDLLEMENELKRQNAEENKNPDIKEEKLLTIPSLADEVPKVEDTKEKEPSLSPLSQKLAVQQKLWESPLFANAAQSTLPPPAENKPLPISMPEVNIFSNPPPNWPIPDLTKPPPPAAVDYSEDPSYKARVEQFLKELEIRSRGPEKKPKRSREDQREKRSSQRAKKKRRKRKGSSSSSNSSSSSDSSSSDSEKEPAKNRKSSLSDSSGSTESADEHKTSKSKKQKKKKKKKKTKKSKSKSKKNVTKEPEMPIPDFQDLENKLLAYYQKMEAIKETPPDKESKPSKNPLKGLKTSSHPAFLDGSPSDSPETDIKTVKPVPPKSTSTASKHKITKDDPKKKMKKKKHISSSSCSTCSSSSRSRSRSFSSRSSSSSGGHYSRYRKRHSRSRPYRGSRRRYSRSRSRRRSRSRKRSRSRRRSRSRQRHFRHSRSRSPRHKRPICSPKKHHVPRRSPPSPGFGYYRNKPVISAQTKGVPTPLPNVDTVPLPPPTNKPPEHKGPKPIKFQIKKMLGAKAVIEKHLSGNLKETPTQPKEESCDSKEVVASPDSARFGKWAKEGTVPKSASATNGKKTPTPAGSLDQFEKFLQSAKQKSIEMMKERNKAFLKPKVE